MSQSIKRPTIEGLPSPAARAPADGNGAPSAGFDLDVVRSVKRHPKLAASVAVVVLALVVYFGLTRVKMYEAQSLTYIEPMASKVLTASPTQDGYDSGRYDTYIQQQMQTALRPDILARAIAKLPPFVWQRPGESMQSAVTRLQGSLKVERISTSYQLGITMSDPNPETAASVVNAVTNTYLEQGRKDEHAAIDQRLFLLGEERQRIQQSLDEDRVEQASLGSALGVANPTGLEGNQYDAQIAGAQTQVAIARQARDVAAAQLASLEGGANAPGLAAAAEETINSDAGLSAMKATISGRKAVLNTQMAGLTPENPIFKQDQAEIVDLDRSLERATTQLRETTERRLKDKTRSDLQRTIDIESRLTGELKRETATAAGAAPKLQHATELAGDIERLTTRYGVVDDAIRGLQLESNGPGSAHLSVAAVVPGGPEPSKRKLILIMAFPLAMFAGVGAAILAHRYDPHIYSGRDVEKVLGFLPIGVMPARAEVSGRVTEEYALRLAAGLQNAYRTSSAQSFVFTPASAKVEIGEFVRSLERVLGTLGFKALAMDTASIMQATNRTPSTQRGMTTYRSSALVRTIDGIRQGYASEEIERLKLKYDLLLIDAPPLLNSAETEYLVRCTDATILVAESGVTVKDELEQSAVLLQHLNVPGVGAVLQELHLKDADPAFRVAIAAAERMQAGRSVRSPQIDAGGDGQEGGSADEAADEVAERLRQMAVPSARTKNPREVASAVVTAGLGPMLNGRRESTDEADEKSEPSIPHGVGRSEVVTGQEPEGGVPDGEMLQESKQVHVEERDQVRPWRELLKKKKEEAPEAPARFGATLAEENMKASEGSPEPEPILYFQDRMRSRKVDLAISSAHDLAAQPATESFVEEPLVGIADSQTWEIEAPVANARIAPSLAEVVNEVGPPEAVQDPVAFAWLSKDLDISPSFTASLTYPERSVLESGTEAHADWPAGQAIEEYLFERKPVAECASQTDAIEEATSLEFELAAERGTEGWTAPEMDVAPIVAVRSVEEPENQEQTSNGGEIADPEPLAAKEVAKTRREPGPAKMEWFTLKFRGTSERVLRIIPGEELPESVEEAYSEPAELDHGTALEEATQAFGDLGRGGNEIGELADPRPSVEVVEKKSEVERESPGVKAEPGTPSITTEPGSASVRAESPLDTPTGLKEWTQAAPEVLADGGSAPERFEVDAFAAAPDSQAWLGAAVDEASVVPHPTAAESRLKVEMAGNGDLAPETAFEATAPSAAETAEGFAVTEGAGPATDLRSGDSVENSRTPRAKINRWAVEDHHPGVSAWNAGLPYASSSSPDGLQDETIVRAETLPGAAQQPTLALRDGDAVESLERFSPVKLIGELHGRPAGMTNYKTSPEPVRGWSRRTAAAPVEERLQPRAAGLTRRWEMLSRFDSSAKQGGAVVGADREVMAAADQGDR